MRRKLTTLAHVAADQGVDVQTLVDDLVTAAQDRLDQAVADGRLTQERADAIAADLPDEIAEHVQEGFPQRGPDRMGDHGPGQGRGGTSSSTTGA